VEEKSFSISPTQGGPPMSTLPFAEPQEMTEDLVIAAVNTHGLESLAVVEEIVITGLDDIELSWIAIGNALAKICERKLYRETHKTFEGFVKARFGLSQSSAYNYIDASGYVQRAGQTPALDSIRAALAAKKKAKPEPEPKPQSKKTESRIEKLRKDLEMVYSVKFDVSASEFPGEIDITFWGVDQAGISDLLSKKIPKEWRRDWTTNQIALEKRKPAFADRKAVNQQNRQDNCTSDSTIEPKRKEITQ
jgi:hypothetical protein